MKETGRRFSLIFAVLVCAFVAACGGGGGGGQGVEQQNIGSSGLPEEPVDFVLADGRQGGSQYPISVAINQVVDTLDWVGSTTINPGGSSANIVAVAEQQAQVGFTLAYSTVDGYNGSGAFEQPYENTRELFALHPFYIAILVGEDSDIETPADLAGKRVNIGPSGFTTQDISRLIFDVYGIEESEVEIASLQITDAVEQFKDGQLDALIYFPSSRFAPYIDLAQSEPLRIVPFGQAEMEEMMQANPSLYIGEWPTEAGIYEGLDEPVPTLATANNIISSEEVMTEEQAYEVVKAVAENLDDIKAVEPSLEELQPEDLAQDIGVPLHPGAERYFEEQGWLDVQSGGGS